MVETPINPSRCPRLRPRVRRRAGSGGGIELTAQFVIARCRRKTADRRSYAPQLRLELRSPMAMLPPCRFTSFIVASASGIAKSWCVPAGGKGPSALIAAPPSLRRNYPCLPLPAARRTPGPRARRAAAEVAAAVGVAAGDITTEPQFRTRVETQVGGATGGAGIRLAGQQHGAAMSPPGANGADKWPGSSLRLR